MDGYECRNCKQKFKRQQNLDKHILNSVLCSKFNDTLKNLNLELKYERIKCGLLKELLRSHTTIPVDDLFRELEDGLHIYDFNKGEIPLIIHSVLKGGKDKQKIYHTAKKEIYKSITGLVKEEGSSSTTEDSNENIEQENPTKEEIKEEGEVKENCISELLETLKTDKKPSKILKQIQLHLNNMLGTCSLFEYITYIKTVISQIKIVLKDKRYMKILSVIISRFLYIDNVIPSIEYSEGIEIDYLEKIKKMLVPKHVHTNIHTNIFNKLEYISYIKNYSLALYPVLNLVKLLPKSGIVYIPISKSSNDDPYSFYTLAKITPHKKDGENVNVRQWKMDCRLEDLSREIADELRNFCIKIFRKIYHDIFKDNHYRPEYNTFSPVLKDDCVQLLMNIRTLAHHHSFRKDFVRIISQENRLIPSENDKVNLSGDDQLQRKRFLTEKDSDEELIVATRELFDNVEHNFNIF